MGRKGRLDGERRESLRLYRKVDRPSRVGTTNQKRRCVQDVRTDNDVVMIGTRRQELFTKFPGDEEPAEVRWERKRRCCGKGGRARHENGVGCELVLVLESQRDSAPSISATERGWWDRSTQSTGSLTQADQ